MHLGQQRGNINNACWDRSHGQGTPLRWGTLRDGVPPTDKVPPRNGVPPSKVGLFPFKVVVQPRDGVPPPRLGYPLSPRLGYPPVQDLGAPLQGWGTPSPVQGWGTPPGMETSGEDGQMIRKL